MDTKLLIALAICLTWLVCLVVCFLKAKYGMAIVGLVAAVAQEVGLPPIGGYYVLNLVYPLWLLPVFGALRLAHPKSYYAHWFYRRNMPKYFRAVQRFGLEQEYAELVAPQAQDAVKEQQTGPGLAMNEEKLRTLLILNNRWPRSVIDYNVVGDRVEVIDPQRKVLTVLSIAELERMKLEYQRGLNRMRKGYLTLQSSIYWSIILIKFVLPAAIILLGIYFAIRFFR